MSYETARDHAHKAYEARTITSERRDTLLQLVNIEECRTMAEQRHRETRPLVAKATVTSPTPRVRMHRLFA